MIGIKMKMYFGFQKKPRGNGVEKKNRRMVEKYF